MNKIKSLRSKLSEVEKLDRNYKRLVTILLALIIALGLFLMILMYYVKDRPVMFNTVPKDTVQITNN
jgi:uncharacterized protein YpmS